MLIRAMQEKGFIAQKSIIIFGVSSFTSNRYLTFALRMHGGCLRSLTIECETSVLDDGRERILSKLMTSPLPAGLRYLFRRWYWTCNNSHRTRSRWRRSTITSLSRPNTRRSRTSTATSADTSYADTSCPRLTTSSTSPQPFPRMVY